MKEFIVNSYDVKKNIKGNFWGWKKMMLDGNMEVLERKKKCIRKSKYRGDYENKLLFKVIIIKIFWRVYIICRNKNVC